MKGQDKRTNRIVSPMVWALVFVTACFLFIYMTYGVYYLTNDDTGIMKTFSGYSTGTPTAFHQYGSITLGMIYKFLYRLIPTWNWYSYGSILVVIVSNAVSIYAIFKQRDLTKNLCRYVDFMIIGIIAVSISMYGISSISWTTNAAFAADAGIMLLMNMSGMKKEKYSQYVCAVIFLFLASLIRGAAYKAALPFAILALIYYTGNRIRVEGLAKKNRILVELVILLIPLLGISGYNHMETALKSNVFPSGTGAFEYYRGLYTDRPHIEYEGNEEFYDSLGWDQEFYDVTKSWMFIDPRFNTENLKKIADASQELREKVGLSDLAGSYMDDFLKETIDSPVRLCMSIAVVVLALAGLIMAIYKMIFKGNWFDWLFLSTTQMLCIAECTYLLMRGRFIERAFYCAAFPALFIGIWILARHASIMNSHKELYLVETALAVALLYISARQNLSMEKSEFAKQQAQISSDADAIYFNYPENLYIYDGYIISGTSLFLDMDLRGCGRNSLMWGGTGVYSKTFYEKIKRFGYDEFYSYNLFDENVYYITTDSDVWNSVFMKYMKKNYGEFVDADVVDTTDSGIYVYKFYRS